MQVKLSKLQMQGLGLDALSTFALFLLLQELDDFLLQKRLHLERLNTHQIFSQLKEILTLSPLPLPLNAHGREMACTLH